MISKKEVVSVRCRNRRKSGSQSLAGLGRAWDRRQGSEHGSVVGGRRNFDFRTEEF